MTQGYVLEWGWMCRLQYWVADHLIVAYVWDKLPSDLGASDEVVKRKHVLEWMKMRCYRWINLARDQIYMPRGVPL